MNSKILIIILSIVSLTSCKDFSDLKLVTKSNSINIINSEIEIALVGSEPIEGVLKIKIGGQTIGEGEIKSHFDSEFEVYKIHFSELGNELNSVISTIRENKELEIHLLFINEQEKLKIEKKTSITIEIPPISRIVKIEGEKFEKINKTTSSLLTEVVKNKTRITESLNQSSNLNILKELDQIRIKLLVDTVYHKTFIWRYPTKNNNFYSINDIESNLIKEMNNDDGKLNTEYEGKTEDGRYVITDEYTVEDDRGEIGLYLINIDVSGNYFIQYFGSYLTDGISPKFTNSSYCSFNGNPKIEGQVCLENKHFYGYNPYNVPFVGIAKGDIAKIFIDKKQVPFKIGQEIFFKKRIYLDGGYNRIPIKIIDKMGNVTESFIPVTIESMTDTKIDIDNEINIDN